MVTVSYWSGTAAENSQLTSHYRQSLSNYEEMAENVSIDLRLVAFGDMNQTVVSAIEAGNFPSMAQSGSVGIDFFLAGHAADHNSWIEETADRPRNQAVRKKARLMVSRAGYPPDDYLNAA